jgi:hypothetical protein
MLRKVKNAFVPDPAVIEMRQTLARRIAAITGRAGEHSTAIPEVWLYQRTTPTPCYRASYEPGLSVFVQGRKRIILGGTEYVCDGSSFLLSSIDVPAQSQIIEASPKTPLLTMFIKLDMPTVREVVSRDDMLTGKAVPHRQALAVGETTVGLLGTCLRLPTCLRPRRIFRFSAR